MTKMYQCELSEVGGTGRTVGWIEERGAKVGAHVEMKEFGGAFWQVDKVNEPAIDSKVLAEKQAMDRRSLPSIAAAA